MIFLYDATQGDHIRLIYNFGCVGSCGYVKNYLYLNLKKEIFLNFEVKMDRVALKKRVSTIKIPTYFSKVGKKRQISN